MALAWSNGHHIVTKLDVDTSVGVYEVYFLTFFRVCGCFT